MIMGQDQAEKITDFLWLQIPLWRQYCLDHETLLTNLISYFDQRAEDSASLDLFQFVHNAFS
jgi:hypothetical protein